MTTTPHATALSIHKGAYIQSTDPGAVGAKVLWIDTTSGYLLKKRNDADAGWDTIGSLAIVGTADIANDAVTYAKIQNVSATDKLLGRSTAGAGDVEEITLTAAGRALIDDADATAQRATLGLGAIAVENTPLSIAKGGTQTTTAPGNGKVLIGKTDGSYAVATITPGTGISITNGDGSITIDNTGGGGGGSGADFVYSARSSNMILAAIDKGKVVFATAGFTQTLTAAATLANGWWCVLRNDTTDGSTLVVDPNDSETIDGLTTLTMSSGDERLVMCDGTAFYTLLLRGGAGDADTTERYKFTHGI